MRKEGLENLSCLLPLNTKGRAVGLFEGGGGVRQVDEMINMFFSRFDCLFVSSSHSLGVYVCLFYMFIVCFVLMLYFFLSFCPLSHFRLLVFSIQNKLREKQSTGLSLEKGLLTQLSLSLSLSLSHVLIPTEKPNYLTIVVQDSIHLYVGLSLKLGCFKV